MDAEEPAGRPFKRQSHPGAILRRQVIPALEADGMTKVAIAKALGIKRQSLYDILSEKRTVTPDMAARLGRYFGNAPQFWLNMQAAHDLWQAERSPSVKAVVALEKRSRGERQREVVE